MSLWQRISEKIDLSALLTRVVASLPDCVAAAVVLLAFFVGYVLARRLLRLYFRKASVPDSIADLLITLLRYGSVIVALVTAADVLGFQVTSLVAGLGIVGLAVSFAAQDTIANIISGITLVVDKPFVAGDWVEVGGINALVTRLHLRTTTLTTFDNQTIVLPNKQIAQERIINYTLVPRIRVRVPVGIAYKEDVQAARQAMLATAQGDPDVLAEPAPNVVVTGLGASSVNLELRFWIEDAARQWPKQWEYMEKCKYALDGADIQIPFPHLQMFLEESDGLAALADLLGRA